MVLFLYLVYFFSLIKLFSLFFLNNKKVSTQKSAKMVFTRTLMKLTVMSQKTTRSTKQRPTIIIATFITILNVITKTTFIITNDKKDIVL